MRGGAYVGVMRGVIQATRKTWAYLGGGGGGEGV